MKLNGWQRLGIVAFLIWAFIGCGLFWVSVHEEADFAYKLCRSDYDRMFNENIPDRFERHQECIKGAESSFNHSWEKGTQFFLRYVALFISVPAYLLGID